MRKYYIAITVLSVVVFAAVVYGFVLAGSPNQQKHISEDQTRLSHFSSIRYSIENYYKTNKTLPVRLTDVRNIENYKDPKTKDSYGYKIVSATSYQLCAEFATDSQKTNRTVNYNFDYNNVDSLHKKGFDCITYTLPSYITSPPVNTATSASDGWIRNKTTQIVYMDTVLNSDDEKRMLVKDTNFANSNVRIVDYTNAQIVNVDGEKILITSYKEGDRLILDVIEQKGNTVKVTKIQNTSR